MKTEVPPWIIEPNLPLTISVIGAGGSGSMFLQHLARVVYAYQTITGRYVSVIVCDGEKVDSNNVGRQAFGANEIGYYKAEIIVSRINRFYGFDWIAVPEHFAYPEKKKSEYVRGDQLFLRYSANFIVSAVDSIATKVDIERFFKTGQGILHAPEYFPYFWIDLGNTKTTGNIIVGSHVMDWPDVFEHKEAFVTETDNQPNCSLAMSLNQQDLFINSQCALVAAKWLWECMTSKEITWRGAFVNLETLLIRKLKTINTNVTAKGTDTGQSNDIPKPKPRKRKKRPAAAKGRKSKNNTRGRKH